MNSAWPRRWQRRRCSTTRQTPFANGSALPPLWHWFYFLPRAPQALLDVDGHPQRGGFMPPIPYPRRMFAGARMRFHAPLLIGQPARREALIRDVRLKSGRSGSLAFVSVVYRFYQDGRLCIEEEQDIVYREPGPAVACPPCSTGRRCPRACRAHRHADPKLLFRFSALTFNAHRIHYDRPYAIGEEGYPGLVVHGPLTAVLLMELVRQQGAQPVQGSASVAWPRSSTWRRFGWCAPPAAGSCRSSPRPPTARRR
jgi:3-methylfumaryl-CoA hydratase